MPAIPSKHPQYTFGETFSGLSTIDLVDDTLYILYTGNDDAALGPRQLLRSFDLRSEGSKHEWAGLNRMERTTARDASCDTWGRSARIPEFRACTDRLVPYDHPP